VLDLTLGKNLEQHVFFKGHTTGNPLFDMTVEIGNTQSVVRE
jgi:hypothetical protein